MEFTVNAPLERDGMAYAIGDEFDPTGMKVKDVRFLVETGVLIPSENAKPIVVPEEEETWQEQL